MDVPVVPTDRPICRYATTFVLLLAPLAACGRQEKADSVQLSSNLQLAVQSVAKGDSADAGIPYVAQTDGQGTLYLGVQSGSQLVEAIDSAGNFLRTFGRHGEGPGEYRGAAVALIHGDTLLLSDPYAGTLAVYSRSGTYVRTITVEREVGGFAIALFFRGDTIVVAKPLHGERTFGYPFHVLDGSARLVRSFGTEDRSIDPAFRSAQLRMIAQESDTSFWAGRYTNYNLELWSIHGQLLKTLNMSRDWFPPLTQDPGALDGERPATTMLSLHRDAHGHLIVLLRRARADWKPRADSSKRERPPMTPTQMMAYMEEVIEVVDTTSGLLLGSMVVKDAPIAGFLRDDRLYGFREDAVGRQVPVVYRLLHSVSR